MTAPLPPRGRCRHCGAEFFKRRDDQVFCSTAHRRAYWSWRESRGAQAVDLLIRWRRDRRRGSLAALTAFADDLLRDYGDREAARTAAERGEP
jgi:hypothetical protein